MRRSAGDCYDIEGARVHRVTDEPAERADLALWQRRQADLWDESGKISHLHRHMTREESGLWHAMWRELQEVGTAIARLEPPSPERPQYR